MRRCAVGSAVLVCAFTASGVAEAKVTLHVAPKSPVATDDIVVTFKTDRTLKPGFHYAYEMFVGNGGREDDTSCMGASIKVSTKEPKKGRTMTMRFRASEGADQEGEATATSWCTGPATVRLYTVKGKGGFRGRLAQKRFTVSAPES